MNTREDDINFEVLYIKNDTPLDEIKNIETRFQRVMLGSSDALRVRGFKTDTPTICVLPDIALGTLEALFQRLVSFPQIHQIHIGILSDASIEAIKMIPVNMAQVYLYDISKEAIQALPRSRNTVHLHNVSKDTIRFLPEHVTGVIINGFTPAETVKELPPSVNSVGILSGVLPSTVAALPEHITTVHIYPESPIDAIKKIPLHIKMASIHDNIHILAIQALSPRIEKRFVPDDSAEKKRKRELEKNANNNNQPQQKRARIAPPAAQVPNVQADFSALKSGQLQQQQQQLQQDLQQTSPIPDLQNDFLDIAGRIIRLQKKYQDERNKFIKLLHVTSHKNNYLENKNNQLLQQVQELSRRNQELEEENKYLKNPLPPLQPTPIKPSYMPRPEILNSNTPIPVPQTAGRRQQGFAPVHGVAIMPSSVSSTHFAAGRSVVIKQEPQDQNEEQPRQEGNSLKN